MLVALNHPRLSLLRGALIAVGALATLLACGGCVAGVVGVVRSRLRCVSAWYGVAANAVLTLFLVAYPVIVLIVAISRRKTPLSH
jgi:hypothetical protein